MDRLSRESVETTPDQRSETTRPSGRLGFWALIATQFQGAFSDNILRNLLLSMIVGMNLAKTERETFVSVVTFLFSVPFLLLSMPGGWLADRFSKRQVTIWTKVMEFGSMLLATAGLATHNLSLSLVALTLVASQAALFGPSKYGMLPELLPEKRLSWGNGVIELGTFLAIIVGTVAGAWMGEHFAGREVYAGYLLVSLSVIGFVTSLGINKLQPAAPEKRFQVNIAGDLWAQIGKMRRDRALYLAVLGNTYFWFLGSLLFSTIVIYGPDVLHIGQTRTGYLNAMLAVGIGIGSMAAGWLSENKIEYGLIPLGSIGMTCTGLGLGIMPHGMAGSAALLGMLGFWAGFFAVPVNALIQHKSSCTREFMTTRWSNRFARMLKAIPISSEQRPREMLHSLRAASDALRNDEIVCIFAEGQITRTGQLLPFRRGLERIMKGVDADVIPVNLDGVWGSIFSFERGRFLWKMPRRIPYRVTVSFGKPMAPASTAAEVRAAVQELQAAAFEARKSSMKTLDRAFVRTARQRPWRFFMADGKTPSVSFGSALNKTVYIARRLRRQIGDQPMVGVLLPPSVGGALTNYALQLMGRVPVNLNYTSSNETMASCAGQCGLDLVITSKAFIERFPSMTIPGRTLVLEDALISPRFSEKLGALLMAWLLPVTLLKRALGARRAQPASEVTGAADTRHASPVDDLATVIFSSGSTGDPKGVMLSHFNIMANISQVSQVFMLDGRDRILGILPFFHSFGFTAGLWLPAVQGIGVVFHPNPLDAQAIGGLVEKYKVTFLVATPTFLQAYMRRCTPESFGSLQYVLVGAEKLPDRVAMAFEDQFGIRPLEGYGCTECSPVVTVNGKDYRAPGFRQVAARRGKIGHPLPGVCVKVIDIETGLTVTPGNSGMLLVKGPNVMRGYLGKPAKTAEVLRDGWYTTGDIGMIEEDGFITITDRLSRFSKIGGEMVPHIRIEEKLHELADATEQVFAVTAVPDEKKGERIIVLHTLPEAQLTTALDKLSRCDLPALWRPKPNQFVHVDSIPILGTGKMDLRAMRALATSLTAESEVEVHV